MQLLLLLDLLSLSPVVAAKVADFLIKRVIFTKPK